MFSLPTPGNCRGHQGDRGRDAAGEEGAHSRLHGKPCASLLPQPLFLTRRLLLQSCWRRRCAAATYSCAADFPGAAMHACAAALLGHFACMPAAARPRSRLQLLLRVHCFYGVPAPIFRGETELNISCTLIITCRSRRCRRRVLSTTTSARPPSARCRWAQGNQQKGSRKNDTMHCAAVALHSPCVQLEAWTYVRCRFVANRRKPQWSAAAISQSCPGCT